MMMKCWVWSMACSAPLLLLQALATYQGSPGRSFAQTRGHGHAPTRTLDLAIHRSDYTYRGGYHYHYQPPRIPPPVVYPPFPLSPPVTYHRPPQAPMWPYQHTFKGPLVPQVPHIYKGPVAHRPQHKINGLLPYHSKKGPCPTKSSPTVATTPVVYLPTVPPTLRQTTQPTLPPTTTTPKPVVTTTAAPAVETTAPVPVSTTSHPMTTVSPVETGLDPCVIGNDCEHTCVNSDTSYYCKCRHGYTLNADQRTCSLKQVKVVEVVVVDPCKCEARLAFQKQTQAAMQQLTAKLADVMARIARVESELGRA